MVANFRYSWLTAAFFIAGVGLGQAGRSGHAVLGMLPPRRTFVCAAGRRGPDAFHQVVSGHGVSHPVTSARGLADFS